MSKPLLPNTTLSHYRIVSKIGEGGMGEVFLAGKTLSATRRCKRYLQPQRTRVSAEKSNQYTTLCVIDFGSNVLLSLARIEGRCHDYARGTG
jgi:serine/threonine protein kinase